MQGLFWLTLIFMLFSAKADTEEREWRQRTELELVDDNNTQIESSLQPKIINFMSTQELNNKLRNNEIIPTLPTSIEVDRDSMITSTLGQDTYVKFEVTNNRQIPVFYEFEVRDDYNSILRITPNKAYISPSSKILVKVDVLLPQQGAGRNTRDTVSFTARWRTAYAYEEVTKKLYLYTESQRDYDSSGPSMWYVYDGDCSRSLHPSNCHNKIWRANISVQDSSGLLIIKSEPVGLILNNEFIVGTKEEVTGFYRATCCQTKVDVTAVDAIGNQRTLTVDIEKKWLSIGEISAIVLGSILLLLLIILLIICIIYVRRRNRRTLSIYPESSRS